MQKDGWPPWVPFDEFDDEPTIEIPRETMRETIEGHRPIGPTKPTRNIRTGSRGEKG